MKAIAPTLSIQDKYSTLPEHHQFLIEKTVTKEGVNWFLFPFAGRLANEDLPLWSVIVCRRLCR